MGAGGLVLISSLGRWIAAVAGRGAGRPGPVLWLLGGVTAGFAVGWTFASRRGLVQGVVAIAGVKDLIERLEPTQWAIVTSAPRTLAETRLRAAGLPVPDIFVSGESVRNGKPDPEGFLMAADLLGAPIAEGLVYEDSPAGVAAGKAAGARVAIVGDLVPASEGDLAIRDYR